MIIGYCRVSTRDQDLTRQIESLKEYGYTDDKIISYVEPNGEHNEIMWRYATAYALEQIILKENENGKN